MELNLSSNQLTLSYLNPACVGENTRLLGDTSWISPENVDSNALFVHDTHILLVKS